MKHEFKKGDLVSIGGRATKIKYGTVEGVTVEGVTISGGVLVAFDILDMSNVAEVELISPDDLKLNHWKTTIDKADLTGLIISRVELGLLCMRRVVELKRKFDIGVWQDDNGIDDGDLCETEEKLTECGFAACFGGWLGVMPEFIELGGGIDKNGSPTFNGHSELYAINVFLGLEHYQLESQSVATVLAHPCMYTLNDKPELVIERLEYLLEKGK